MPEPTHGVQMQPAIQVENDGLLSLYKNANRQYPTGVTIVTAHHRLHGPSGLTVNAFSSVSMEPPTVLVCVNRASRSHHAIFDSEVVGVSVLASDQADVAAAFASSNGSKFASVGWHPSTAGAPLINDAAAAFEVRIVQRVAAGSHTIFLGEVTDVEIHPQRPPLAYCHGSFHDGAKFTTD